MTRAFSIEENGVKRVLIDDYRDNVLAAIMLAGADEQKRMPELRRRGRGDVAENRWDGKHAGLIVENVPSWWDASKLMKEFTKIAPELDVNSLRGHIMMYSPLRHANGKGRSDSSEFARARYSGPMLRSSAQGDAYASLEATAPVARSSSHQPCSVPP
jgi:hypothetical protein